MKYQRLFILSVVVMACFLLMCCFGTNEGMVYSLGYPMAAVGFVAALVFCFLDDKKKTKDDDKKE